MVERGAMTDSAAKGARPPPRVSIFLTPAALLLAIAFVGAFYWATIPVASLREQREMLPIAVLALVALGIPVAGFWRNRRLFALARANVQSRVATILIFEAFALLLVLFMFANMTSGGEDESSLRSKASTLTVEAAEVRKLIEHRVGAQGALTGVGEGLKVESTTHRGETFLGRNGAVLLYDLDLRALVALVPTYHNRILDWRLLGLPARAFPAHWRTVAHSSLTRDAPGDPTEHSQELLKVASQLQQEISAHAKRQGTLVEVTDARTLPQAGLVDFGYVDGDGRFALYSDRHGVFLVYEPSMRSDGRVDWRCRSYPSEGAVPGCASAFN